MTLQSHHETEVKRRHKRARKPERICHRKPVLKKPNRKTNLRLIRVTIEQNRDSFLTLLFFIHERKLRADLVLYVRALLREPGSS